MVRAGDTTAFGVLYERHERAARRLARYLVGAPGEIDDVVAETFARVLDVTQRGGGPTDAVRTYLLTSLRRVCHDRYKARRAKRPADTRPLPDQGGPAGDLVAADLAASDLT